MTFEGFPEQALVFYEGLRADNTKAYWTDHKAVYDSCVKAPMEALLARLEPEFGSGKLFRPYRDVRFSKDKTPYKDHAGAALYGMDGSSGLYVQLNADGLYVAGGSWRLESDQVARLRLAVADDASGPRLAKLLKALERKGWSIGGDRLVRVPKPFDAEHPRANLLRAKSLSAGYVFEPDEWLHEPECLAKVVQHWRDLKPLLDWLGRHVGPSRPPAP
ncbi:MAG: DUF2461 domain-containing protein [Actinobacteria bacterium]|nr:DUF2461 domain-containing protein [Actinomycetota bacterium]MCA1720914.1 DUF2461 domain-containing protein [Actinomycetota bacterium]